MKMFYAQGAKTNTKWGIVPILSFDLHNCSADDEEL
jgi:hypothetical protein